MTSAKLSATVPDLGASATAARRTHVPRGLLLQWHITERCNLHCAHCYQAPAAAHAPELDPGQWGRILHEFGALLAAWRRECPDSPPWGQVTVTGGEPFVHPRFPHLVDELARHRHSYSFAVLTNGWFIDGPTARWLGRCKPRFVQVSLEGDEVTHDRIRGRGSFARAVAALASLRRAGVRTLISFTVHRRNFREFPEVVRWARRLGVHRVWADRMIPCGTGESFRHELLDPDETRQFFELMAQCRRREAGAWFRRTEVAMHRALQFLVAGTRPYRCTAGDSLLALSPDGTIVPCRRLPLPVGNLQRVSLRQLYHHSALLQRLRDPDLEPEGCGGCSLRHHCGGGLRCLAHAVHGTPFRADPGCWLAWPGSAGPSRPALKLQPSPAG